MTDQRPRGEHNDLAPRGSFESVGRPKGGTSGRLAVSRETTPLLGSGNTLWRSRGRDSRERRSWTKRVSGTTGDGRSADWSGESLGEDESQEGIGLCTTLNKRCTRYGLPAGQALKTAYPNLSRGLITST